VGGRARLKSVDNLRANMQSVSLSDAFTEPMSALTDCSGRLVMEQEGLAVAIA